MRPLPIMHNDTRQNSQINTSNQRLHSNDFVEHLKTQKKDFFKNVAFLHAGFQHLHWLIFVVFHFVPSLLSLSLF